MLHFHLTMNPPSSFARPSRFEDPPPRVAGGLAADAPRRALRRAAAAAKAAGRLRHGAAEAAQGTGPGQGNRKEIG